MSVSRILCGCALAITTTITTVTASPILKPAASLTPSPVMTQPRAAEPTAPRACIDQMLTEPDYDELEPQPIADTVDGGCMTSPEPIST